MTVNQIRKEFRASKKDKQSFNTLAVNLTKTLATMDDSAFVSCMVWAYNKNGYLLTVSGEERILLWRERGATSPDAIINVMCAICVDGRDPVKSDVDTCHSALWRNVYNGKLNKKEIDREGYVMAASIGGSYTYTEVYIA